MINFNINSILDDITSFAIIIIDLDTDDIIYSNEHMKDLLNDTSFINILSDKSCYKVNNCCKKNVNLYEQFHENSDKWFQVQEKIINKNKKDIFVAFFTDISLLKAEQSKLIDTYVSLREQTVSLNKAKNKLKIQANIDPMTKLYNRRYFQDISIKLVKEVKQKKTNLSIVILDIDKFKSINDTYGHSIGDDIIIALSKIFKESSYKNLIPSRFGGDEFILLLPDTVGSQAVNIAEHIRYLVENKDIEISDKIKINFTISLGISEVSLSDDTIDDALNGADNALYKAKENGRNNVVLENR